MNYSQLGRLTAVAIMLGAISLQTNHAAAQTDSKSAFEQNERIMLETEYDANSEKFRLDFPGGTVEEFVDLLRSKPFVERQRFQKTSNSAWELKISDKPLNVIISDDAKQIRMPEVKIVTDMLGAFNLFDYVETPDYSVIFQEIDSDNEIYSITVEWGTDKFVDVINARQLLVKTPEADLLSAIEIGFQMRSPSNQVQLKLHKETGLLFVRGTEDENRLVNSIVNELMIGQGLPGMGSSGGPGGGFGGGGFGGGAGMGSGPGVGGFGGAGAGASPGNRPKGGGKFSGVGAGAGMGVGGGGKFGGGGSGAGGPGNRSKGAGKFSGGDAGMGAGAAAPGSRPKAGGGGKFGGAGGGLGGPGEGGFGDSGGSGGFGVPPKMATSGGGK